MKLNTDDMPLMTYGQLTVPKPVQDLVKSECFEEGFLGEFVPRKQGKEEVNKDESDMNDKIHVFSSTVIKSKVWYPVDPLYHGWLRTLRIINYLRALYISKKHDSHLIQDPDCQICSQGRAWDPRTDENGAEKILFRIETSIIKDTVKTEKLLQYCELDGVLYYQGRLPKEYQFRITDLDQVSFIFIFITTMMLFITTMMYS